MKQAKKMKALKNKTIKFKDVTLSPMKKFSLTVILCCFFFVTFGQSKEIKMELLNYMAKNHKLDFTESKNIEKYIPYLVITEVVKLDHNWNRDYGIYRFEIHSESAPDLLIKIKDKFYIQNPNKLDDIIEAIINLNKSTNDYFKLQDILLYIEKSIQIYRDNEYVKNQRIIG